MARNIHRLPEDFVERQPKSSRSWRPPEPGKHHDGGGLYVIVKESGAVHYVLRCTLVEKRTEMGLGSNKTCTFKDARDEAMLAQQRIKNGIDPRQAKKEEAKADEREQGRRKTVAEACEDYVKSLERKVKKMARSPDWLKQAKSVINRFINPVLGDLLIWNVEGNECADMIISIAEKTPGMANAVEAHGKAIFKRAQQNNWYPPQQLNPFSRKGPLGLKLEELEIRPPEHYKGVPVAEISAFMQRLKAPRISSALLIAEAEQTTGIDRSEILRKIHSGDIPAFRREDRPTAPWFIEPRNLYGVYEKKNELLERPLNSMASLALQFAFLLAVRPKMVRNMLREEVDPVERIWTVPWHKHKIGRRTHKPLYLPLSSHAMAVYRQAEEFQKGAFGARSQFVFAHGRSLTWEGKCDGKPLSQSPIQNVFDATLDEHQIQLGYTVYGIRRVFCTWAYEKAGKYLSDAIEMSLGHVHRTRIDTRGYRCTDVTREAYDGSQLIPQRRQLMEDWGKICTSPVPVPSQVLIEANRLDAARRAKVK